MQTDKVSLFGGHSICTSIKKGTLGYFARCRHDGQYGVLTCAHVVDSYDDVISEETEHRGNVIRRILNGPRNVDGAFIKFDKDNMSFQFVDHSVLALPIIEIADIQIHSEYKYYGNTSWREGNSPVTGTIESKNAELTVGGYTFTKLIRLSKQVKRGDSGALLLSQDGHAIGMVFASFGHCGFAIPIENVLNSLEVDITIV